MWVPDAPRQGEGSPVVSVLMPCFNAASTLVEALESLSRQTLPDFEIVAVDDGSTDATRELLSGWSERDPRLRVLSQPHRGIIAALNAGLAACRAACVARMDADDRCYPQRLEKQVAYLDAHPDVAVVGCQVAGFPPGEVHQGLEIYLEWQNALLTDEDVRREIFVESPLAHPSVMFRQERIVNVGGYQEHGWAEDYDLWLRLYLAEEKFAKLPEVLLEWRERPNRLTRTDGRYSLENFLRLKACYLPHGPLAGRDAVILWGAGMIGRRLSKHLQRQGVPLAAFIDIDPLKIGHTRLGLSVLPPEDLLSLWRRYDHPVLLAAVGARGARRLIRQRLEAVGLQEGRDWWPVA